MVKGLEEGQRQKVSLPNPCPVSHSDNPERCSARPTHPRLFSCGSIPPDQRRPGLLVAVSHGERETCHIRPPHRARPKPFTPHLPLDHEGDQPTTITAGGFPTLQSGMLTVPRFL